MSRLSEKAVNCHFEFHNNTEGTFYAGQELSGTVTLEVTRPKRVNGVKLDISGFAHTRWTEGGDPEASAWYICPPADTRSTTYSGSEDYLATRTQLLGSEESDSVLLEPGLHVFNFACQIPPSCPSSFEGSYGQIRYKLKVALIRTWSFNLTFTKGFTVLRILDLNYESPLLKMPADSIVEKVFNCGPCATNPIRIIVRIPQSGYVSGQKIPVTVLVANEGNVVMQKLKLSLVMMICYRSQFPAAHMGTERIAVTKLSGEYVELMRCTEFFNFELEVPATPPSCTHFCRLIQIDYHVLVEVEVSIYKNPVLCLPVTIGNMPIMAIDAIVQQPTTSSRGMQYTLTTVGANTENKDESTDQALVDGASALSSAFILPWTDNANIPPPRYEEASHTARAHINEEEAHDYGESDFAPRYPVFNVASPAMPIIEVCDRDLV